VKRSLAAFGVAAAAMLACSTAAAEQLLNVELSGGAGVTAWNEATESALSPPFVQAQVSYLPLRVGPVSMGPVLGLPVGFYQSTGQGSWSTQVGLRAGWQVYGRPSVDFAWSAMAAADFVISPLDDERDPVDFVWGLEIGGSVVYFLTAGFGVTAGLRYAFFYGVDPVHAISGQLGLVISYEVVP
jgi:hypothetical protein